MALQLSPTVSHTPPCKVQHVIHIPPRYLAIIASASCYAYLISYISVAKALRPSAGESPLKFLNMIASIQDMWTEAAGTNRPDTPSRHTAARLRNTVDLPGEGGDGVKRLISETWWTCPWQEEVGEAVQGAVQGCSTRCINQQQDLEDSFETVAWATNTFWIWISTNL